MEAVIPVNKALEVSDDFFCEFLKNNKAKIEAIAEENPTISIDDEWRDEDFWDEDDEEM